MTHFAAPTVLPTRRLRRMPSLDGVRTIAVIFTSLIHLAPNAVPGGFIGVDMFFVLSGFLITSLLIGEWDRYGRIPLGRFYVRRARRLLPAVLLLGLVFTVTAVLLDHSTRNLVVTAVADAGLLSYTLNWAGVLQHDVPWQVDHLWSLSVEEQFYLLWPMALIVLLPRVRRTTLMWITGLAAAGSVLLQAVSFLAWHSVNISYLASPLRAEGILLGCLLAQWYCWR
ncbi:acyltransferase family protein, partial [Micromonospora sp.]|uniref:acyltransferase family protein n=1 Tax=Micromonospora sp. TaxID=1876 RepID=UPI003B3BBD02